MHTPFENTPILENSKAAIDRDAAMKIVCQLITFLILLAFRLFFGNCLCSVLRINKPRRIPKEPQARPPSRSSPRTKISTASVKLKKEFQPTH